MEALRSPIILTCLLLYLVMCIGVGLWALRRTHSTRDFFVAGRNLGVAVTGMAVFSSTLSGFGFVGGPGLVYSMGMSSIWMVVPAAFSFTLAFFLLAKRLRLMAEVRDTISIPDVVAARYSSDTTRVLCAIAILLGVMGYLATQILAMATVLQSILIQSGVVSSIPLHACVAISVTVLVFYCVTGGIIASVYTDVVQGGIMIVAGVLVFATSLAAVDGGMSGISGVLEADDPASIGPFGTLGILGCMSWYLVFGIGLAGQPHITSKLMMNRSITDARFILPLAFGGFVLSALLWIGIGLAMRALVASGGHAPLEGADLAAPEFLHTYANPVLAGIVFAALFAAIMSTADGFLNIGAAAVVHDIPRALRGRSLEGELAWARIGTVVLALVAGAFALYSYYANERLVALLGAFGWSTFAGALVPVVVVGLNWKRATALAANTAIVTSLLVNFSIELFGINVPFGIDGGALAILLSLALFLGVSLASSPPKLDEDVELVMDL